MIKPLESKEARDNRIKKRNIFLGIIIAIVMVGGTVGWAVLSNEETQTNNKYNGFTFVQTDNYWQTRVNLNNNPFILSTRLLPQEVENVSSSGTPNVQGFYGKTVYIVATSTEEKEASLDFIVNFQNIVNRIQFACPEEEANESFCADIPIKTCADVTFENAIIIINEKENATSNLDYSSGCLKIEGSQGDEIRAMDKALFIMFGVIK